MVILDLWGMVFHAMVVIAPIFILLLECIWACCVHTEKKKLNALRFIRVAMHIAYSNANVRYILFNKNPPSIPLTPTSVFPLLKSYAT